MHCVRGLSTDSVKLLRRFFYCFCDIVKCLDSLGIYFKGTTGGSHCAVSEILSLFLGLKLQRNLLNEQNGHVTWNSFFDPSPLRWPGSPDSVQTGHQASLRASDNKGLSGLIFTNDSVESHM